jgi:hypothetical protein
VRQAWFQQQRWLSRASAKLLGELRDLFIINFDNYAPNVGSCGRTATRFVDQIVSMISIDSAKLQDGTASHKDCRNKVKKAMLGRK